MARSRRGNGGGGAEVAQLLAPDFKMWVSVCIVPGDGGRLARGRGAHASTAQPYEGDNLSGYIHVDHASCRAVIISSRYDMHSELLPL